MEKQLELPISEDVDSKLNQMQSHLNAMDESMGKVRRAVFAEVSELKKLVLDLHQENEQLKSQLRQLLAHTQSQSESSELDVFLDCTAT